MPARRPAGLGDAALFSFSGLALLAGLAVVGTPRTADDRDFVAVFPPWTDQAEAARAAAAIGGSLLAFPARFVATIHSDTPGAASLLEAQGAMLVLPARSSGMCGVRQGRPRRA